MQPTHQDTTKMTSILNSFFDILVASTKNKDVGTLTKYQEIFNTPQKWQELAARCQDHLEHAIFLANFATDVATLPTSKLIELKDQPQTSSIIVQELAAREHRQQTRDAFLKDQSLPLSKAANDDYWYELHYKLKRFLHTWDIHHLLSTPEERELFKQLAPQVIMKNFPESITAKSNIVNIVNNVVPKLFKEIAEYQLTIPSSFYTTVRDSIAKAINGFAIPPNSLPLPHYAHHIPKVVNLVSDINLDLDIASEMCLIFQKTLLEYANRRTVNEWLFLHSRTFAYAMLEVTMDAPPNMRRIVEGVVLQYIESKKCTNNTDPDVPTCPLYMGPNLYMYVVDDPPTVLNSIKDQALKDLIMTRPRCLIA